MFDGSFVKANLTNVSTKADGCQYNIKKAVGVTDTTECSSRGADVPGCVWV